MNIVVIADDITGANDTGVQFAKAGINTMVLMRGRHRDYVPSDGAVVIDTDSRALPAGQAYETVKEVCRWVGSHDFSVVFKKIDSTLRGHVAEEISAALDAGLADLALVAPAMPKNGRKTIGGYHLLQDIPLALTEIARDLRSPVTESHLPTLLRQGTPYQVGHVDFTVLARGEAAVREEIMALRQQGCCVICCDVCFDHDLAVIVQAGLTLPERVLWVGAAGLAECLARALTARSQSSLPHRPVVVLAGSVSEVTRRQVAQLQAAGVTALNLAAAALFRPQEAAAHLVDLSRRVTELVAAGRDVVITSGETEADVQAALAAGAQRGLTPAAVGETIAAAFGRLAAAAADAGSAGLVLTGGDTAAAVCQALGVHGLQVIDEVAFGIPLGEIRTAQGQRLRVVTKAGAFGDAAALLTALQALKAPLAR